MSIKQQTMFICIAFKVPPSQIEFNYMDDSCGELNFGNGEEKKLLEFVEDLDFDAFLAKIDDEDVKKSLKVGQVLNKRP